MFQKFNEYYLKARVFPALITAIPFVLLKHNLLDQHFDFSLTQLIFGDVSILIVLIYLFSQLNRYISKSIFENKTDFPTDRNLLPSNPTLSQQYRAQLAQKILKDFGLELPNLEDEENDYASTKIRIREIVNLIINKTRNGHLLLQHNIEYGFVRNFLGGSAVASLMSIFNILLFFIQSKYDLAIISIILLVIYASIIAMHKKILEHYGKEYAQILFREYLGAKQK